MKHTKGIALFLLVALSAFARPTVRVDLESLTGRTKTNVPITLRWAEENPTTAGTSLVPWTPITQRTGTNSQTSFTNVVNGYFYVDVNDTPLSSWQIYVPTNDGTFSAVALLTNVAPRRSATNYLTTITGDARYYPLLSNPSNYVNASITNGLGGGSGDVDLTGLATLAQVAATNTAGTNSSLAALQAGDAAVSNIVNGVTQSNSVTDTNLFYTYGSDTNTVSVAQSLNGSPGYTNDFVWVGTYGTNNVSGVGHRSYKFDSGSGYWLLAANAANTIWATNMAAGRLYGEYRTNLYGGCYWVLTPKATLATNLAIANVIRGAAVYLDDWGGRGDARQLYGVSISNAVVTAPGASFTTNDIGKTFILYEDTTNIVSDLTQIVSVQSPTNCTLTPAINNLVLTNLYCGYGTENQPQASNALWNSSLPVVGGELILGPGAYLFGRSFITSQLTNASVLNIPEPVLNRLNATGFEPTNPAVNIRIRGSGGTPSIFPQFIKNNADTVGRSWSGSSTMINVARPALVGRTAFIRHEPLKLNESPTPPSAFDDFGWNRPGLANVLILNQVLPKMDAVWFEWAGTPLLDNVVIDVDRPANFYDVNNASPKVFPSNISPYFFTREQTNNIELRVNITNASLYVASYTNVISGVTNINPLIPLAVGIRLPRAYNYAGTHMSGVHVFNHGIGKWLGEHGEDLFPQIGENTIGIFAETSDFYEGAGRGSSSASVLVAPKFFMNVWNVVASTNGTRNYLTMYSPNFESQAMGFPTASITDPANRLAGLALGVSGTDTFICTNSSNFVYHSVNAATWNMGANAITNAGPIYATSFTGSGAGLTAIPPSGITSPVTNSLSGNNATNLTLLSPSITGTVSGTITNTATETNSATRNYSAPETHYATSTNSAIAFRSNNSFDIGSGNTTAAAVYCNNVRVSAYIWFNTTGAYVYYFNDANGVRFRNASSDVFTAGMNTNGFWTLLPVTYGYSQPTTNGLTAQGAIFGDNGTNTWVVHRDSGGVLSTNKISTAAWP